MKPKRITCISAGSGTLKLGEFEFAANGQLILRDYAVEPLGPEAGREQEILERLKSLRDGGRFGGREAGICLAAGQVFTKAVKLPPVESCKIGQIIQYEAQQCFPYALEEAVWDFQVVGVGNEGSGLKAGIQVLLAGAKAAVVERAFRLLEGSGLQGGVVEAPQGALVNAFRFNYPEFEGCAAILEVGAKSSTICLLDGEQFWARSFNLGANQITSDFSAEMKIGWAKAEQLKLDVGMVSLGGAYEEPEKREEAVLAKVARQFMTRLHVQVQQTVQGWRQQGGRTPVRMYLAGGGTLLPFTREFFAEKLKIEVEYLNPIRRVTPGEGIDESELGKVAPALVEIGGLALREVARCPVELNLVPKALRRKQEFAKKKPYFAASVVCVITGLLAYGIFFQQLEKKKQEWYRATMEELLPLEKRARQLDRHQRSIEETKREIDRLTRHLDDKVVWSDRLVEMRRTLLEMENERAALGERAGVWIEAMREDGAVEPEEELREVEQTQEAQIRQMALIDRVTAVRYFGEERVAKVLGGAIAQEDEMMPGTSLIRLRLRALSLNEASGESSANSVFAYDVVEAFRRGEMWSGEGTRLDRINERSGMDGRTFSFEMSLAPKNGPEM